MEDKHLALLARVFSKLELNMLQIHLFNEVMIEYRNVTLLQLRLTNFIPVLDFPAQLLALISRKFY